MSRDNVNLKEAKNTYYPSEEVGVRLHITTAIPDKGNY
jgi:hypothetical protein